MVFQCLADQLLASVFRISKKLICSAHQKGSTQPLRKIVSDYSRQVNLAASRIRNINNLSLFSFSVTCEKIDTKDVNCNPNQVIVIQNAVYGRYSNMKTCRYKRDITCTISATCIVKRLCDGRQNCTIAVETAMFELDPCPGIQKYLYLEYNCVDRVVPVKQFVGK